ncbi:MAG: hypothetical protein ACYDA6_03950 [Solirubrobacteraceae bacterium]
MSETIIVPWYATGLRADRFEPALGEVAAKAVRYGATSYAVYRSMDDRYRFQQLAAFEDHEGWERYWDGPEMIDFRTRHAGWYQVPLLYGPWTCSAHGALIPGTDGEVSDRAGAGHAARAAPVSG